MSGWFLFYLENPQLLKKDFFRWRQLVMAICCASYTCLLCLLSYNHCFKIIFGLGFITNIFCIECLYVKKKVPSFGNYGFGSWEFRHEANGLLLTNKDRLLLEKLLIDLREETERVARNKYKLDCFRIRELHTVKDSVQSFLGHFQPSSKQWTSNCEIHVTTVSCNNNGLLLEILFTPRLQNVWRVIQVSVFYVSVTVTYCFTGYLRIQSLHNIDFNWLYNIGDTEEHKVDRLMWRSWMCKQWLQWSAVLHKTTAWIV